MTRVVGIGHQDFETVIQNNLFYIDKTNLLEGHSFRANIDEQIVFSQLDNDENAVWSLLLASGYLKAEQHSFNPETGEEEYVLALTNFETRVMFRRIIRGWFAKKASDVLCWD